MADFLMLMKGGSDSPEDWTTYIDELVKSGMFRGGSSLGNGVSISKTAEAACSVVGYMRFEAPDIGTVRALLKGNPTFESGGEIEILEMIET